MNNVASNVSLKQMSNYTRRCGKMKSNSALTEENMQQVDPFMFIIMNMMMQQNEQPVNAEGEPQSETSELENTLITAFQNQGLDSLQQNFSGINPSIQGVIEQLQNIQNGDMKLDNKPNEILQKVLETISEEYSSSSSGKEILANNPNFITLSNLLSDNQLDLGTFKNVLNKTNADISGTQTSTSMLDSFAGNVEKVKQTLESYDGEEKTSDNKELDVDFLIQQLNSEKPTTPFELHLKNITPKSETPVLEQMKFGIKQNINAGNEEFTIKLNPESLGQITVKIVEEAGKKTLSILASNSETVKLINNDLSALKEAVAPMGVKVEEAVMNISQSAAMHQFQMSERQYEAQQYIPQSYQENFIDGQQNAQQEFAGQQFTGQQFASQQENANTYHPRGKDTEIYGSEGIAIEENPNIVATMTKNQDRLDYYI